MASKNFRLETKTNPTLTTPLITKEDESAGKRAWPPVKAMARRAFIMGWVTVMGVHLCLLFVDLFFMGSADEALGKSDWPLPWISDFIAAGPLFSLGITVFLVLEDERLRWNPALYVGFVAMIWAWVSMKRFGSLLGGFEIFKEVDPFVGDLAVGSLIMAYFLVSLLSGFMY